MLKQLKKFNLFSERVLVILISLVTLFLQLISFATTWDGAKIYLDGIFPYASLLFAIAIQATAYFFSNSLRKKKSALKIMALCLAICCSTYYSYIGIYNSVNSPLRYMQETYQQINDELTRLYDSQMEKELGEIRTTVSEAFSYITEKHQILGSDFDHINACLTALDETKYSISSGMRAPKQSAYETYEEYAVAYKSYIDALSSGQNVESNATREGILASYGFSDLKALNEEKSQLEGTRATLYSLLQVTESAEFSSALSSLSTQILTRIHNASLGVTPAESLLTDLNILLQASALLGYPEFSAAEIMTSLNHCAELASTGFMASFTQLAGDTQSPEKAMELKGFLDSEILTALLKLNTLLPENGQLDLKDEAYQITDLYLIPLKALTDKGTKLTALFCLAMAGLVDGLSVIFAISLRGKKPLWKGRTLPHAPMDERYIPQICASLPPDESPANGFRKFLEQFVPSPETEAQGYMLRASLEELDGFHLLAALLCQINLAKIVSGGASTGDKQYLLLKAGFVFWVNEILYEEHQKIGGVA